MGPLYGSRLRLVYCRIDTRNQRFPNAIETAGLACFPARSGARQATHRSEQRSIEPGHGRHVVLLDAGELRTKCLGQCRHVDHTADDHGGSCARDGFEDFINHV